MNFNPIYIQTKENLNRLLENIIKFEQLKQEEHKNTFIHEHFQNLKKEVDVMREKHKQFLDNYYDSLLKKVDSLESDCKSKQCNDISDIIRRNVDQFERQYQLLNKEAHKLILDETRFHDINNKIRENFAELKSKTKEIENLLLNNKTYKFKKACNIIDPEKQFGKIFITDNSIPHDLISCSDDNTIKIWNLDNHECMQTLLGHTNTIYGFKFLNNNKLISYSADKTIRIWNLTTGECIKSFYSNRDISTLIKIKEDEFLTGHKYGEIKLWNVNKNQPVKSLLGHTKEVSCFEYNPSRNQLISNSVEQCIKVWDLNSIKCVLTIKTENYAITKINLLPNSNHLICGTKKGKILKCDLNNSSMIELFDVVLSDIWSIELLPNNRLATGFVRGIKIWDLNTNKCIVTLNDTLASSLVLLTNDILISGSQTTIKVWDLNSYKCMQILLGHSGQIRDLDLIKRIIQ